MKERSNLNPKHESFLKRIEQSYRITIPVIDKDEKSKFGIQIEQGNIIGLNLSSKIRTSAPFDQRWDKALVNKLIRKTEDVISNISFFLKSSLKFLNLGDNSLKDVTNLDYLASLKSLEQLHLAFNGFKSLPLFVEKLESLKKLDIQVNSISELPKSLESHQSLNYINISKNEISKFPNVITKLKGLEHLILKRNQLTSVPSSIERLKSLKILDLSYNQLVDLPEQFGGLQALEELSLRKNNFTTLPYLLWKCNKLRKLDINDNPLTNEPKGIEKFPVPSILEIARRKTPIIVFISHSIEGGVSFGIEEFKDYFNDQEEIENTFCSGEYDVVNSNIILFIASRNSIIDENCIKELNSAIAKQILIIPIKESSVEWGDLSQINLVDNYNLSDKLGIEFKDDDVKSFYKDLYEYLLKFKHKVNLFDPEARKLNEFQEKLSIKVKSFLDSEEFKQKATESLEDLLNLYKQFKSDQISFPEYFLKCALILNTT
jgi:hypothetical protein